MVATYIAPCRGGKKVILYGKSNNFNPSLIKMPTYFCITTL
jgi:hypothetical protein